MTFTQPADLYPIYVEFQDRLRAQAVTTCVTAAAQEHYGRVFRPAPREVFEARLENMTAREKRHRTAVWLLGFDSWLRAELGELAGSGNEVQNGDDGGEMADETISGV